MFILSSYPVLADFFAVFFPPPPSSYVYPAAGIRAWKARTSMVLNHASQAPVGDHECHETYSKAANQKILTSWYQWTFYLIKNSASESNDGALKFGEQEYRWGWTILLKHQWVIMSVTKLISWLPIERSWWADINRHSIYLKIPESHWAIHL